VLATFDSSSGAGSVENGKLKAGVEQFFATGTAADALASKREIRELFRRQAEKALTGVDAFNERERTQARMTLDLLACATKVPADRFDRVITNAEDLSLFPDPAVGVLIRNVPTQRDQVAAYIEYIGLQVGDTDARTLNLQAHKTLVCALLPKS
jgi:hypothetical protein